jgi:hypothetical protein
MEIRKTENQFREDEIAYIKHFDKQRQVWVVNPHPEVGGRLRLAHEGNEALWIEADIVKYDGNTAVVNVVVSATKGRFWGHRHGQRREGQDPRHSHPLTGRDEASGTLSLFNLYLRSENSHSSLPISIRLPPIG